MKSHELEWGHLYPSFRTPVFGANAVATSQPLAAQAGLQMLLRGGNAVDAAIATAITLTVVEPTMNGIGGDAFALVWDGESLHGLNASGRSPRGWTLDMFRGLTEMPATGWQSVTVPGAVSSWIALSRRFGVLPFSDLFQPAIEYAREGFMISPFVARTWAGAAAKYRDSASFAETFLPGGRAPLAGEVFCCEEQAETLSEIAETFGESFYRGRIAALIASYARSTGGLLREDDLAAHVPEWVEPVTTNFGQYTVHEMPPNSQGVATLIALALLSNTGIWEEHPDAVDSLDLQLRAMFVANGAVRAHVADPGSMEHGVASLLAGECLEELRHRMDRWPDACGPVRLEQSGGDTVYLTAADSSGMMVSFIQSNYFGFGSGIVVPGTGISLHSRAAGFSLDPSHPNVVAGGKRPFHTLCPAFASSQGRALISFGVMGGPMQPQGHVQIFLRMCAHGQNPQAACDAPRWHVTNDGNVLLEHGFSDGVQHELRDRGHHVWEAAYGDAVFGGGQFILSLPDGYCVASDPRRDGQAVVL